MKASWVKPPGIRRSMRSAVSISIRASLGRPTEMHFHHEIGVGRQPPGEAGWRHDRTSPGIPTQELTGRHARRRQHFGKSGRAVPAVERPTPALLVDADEDMMDGARVPGNEFQSPDRAILRQGDADHEVAVDVDALRSEEVRPIHGGDEIRGAQRPSGRPTGWWRRRCRIALGRSVRDPASEQGQFGVGEPAFVREMAVSGFRQPRRHQTLFENFEQVTGVFAKVRVGE